jgi:hypothetical protein
MHCNTDTDNMPIADCAGCIASVHASGTQKEPAESCNTDEQQQQLGSQKRRHRCAICTADNALYIGLQSNRRRITMSQTQHCVNRYGLLNPVHTTQTHASTSVAPHMYGVAVRWFA